MTLMFQTFFMEFGNFQIYLSEIMEKRGPKMFDKKIIVFEKPSSYLLGWEGEMDQDQKEWTVFVYTKSFSKNSPSKLQKTIFQQ